VVVSTYLLHPFAQLRVEAMVGNAAKLVEFEPARAYRLLGQRPGAIPNEGGGTEVHEAAMRGDVRTIVRIETRSEFMKARDAETWTPRAIAAIYGSTEAVEARGGREDCGCGNPLGKIGEGCRTTGLPMMSMIVRPFVIPSVMILPTSSVNHGLDVRRGRIRAVIDRLAEMPTSFPHSRTIG
jgi:hypothetical protein